MTARKTVTLTLTDTEANTLLLHLNAASVFYAAKADRQNASLQVKRINAQFLDETRGLWRKVYQARCDAGVTFFHSAFPGKEQ